MLQEKRTIPLWHLYEIYLGIMPGFPIDVSKFVALSGLFLHESYLACKNKIAASDTSSSNSTIFWALWSALHLTLTC
jgi:hypothetical protein